LSDGCTRHGAQAWHQKSAPTDTAADRGGAPASTIGECTANRPAYRIQHPDLLQSALEFSPASLQVVQSQPLTLSINPLPVAFSSRRLSLALSLLAAAGASIFGSSPAFALDPKTITPILRSVDGADALGFNVVDGNSFGFFFDVTGQHVFANALGFGFQPDWYGNPASLSYEVTLWSYVLDPISFFGTYATLASKQFSPTDPEVTLADSALPPTGFGNYYWLALDSKIDLPNTGPSVDPDDLAGYILGVTGVFDESPGSVLVAAGGTPDFSPFFTSYLFEGYNFPGGEDAPVPIYAYAPSSGTGFWNANVSIGVPGPLPIMGVGSAFLWSRRLKRKINSRKS
jgi:hypothetical protein